MAKATIAGRYRCGRAGVWRVVRVCAVALAVQIAAGARAQSVASCAGRWLPGDGVPGVVGTVNAIVSLANRDVVVGGTITAAGGTVVNNVARFDAASGVWRAMGAGVNGAVNAMVVLPGGDVVVGGSFSSAGGVNLYNIARVQPSTNVWSTLGTLYGPSLSGSGSVNALLLMPNGDVMVGGSFSSIYGGAVAGLQADNLARFHTASNTWTVMLPGVNQQVNAMAMLSNGDLAIGGKFTSAGGLPILKLARYSPVNETWSDSGVGAMSYSEVYSISALPSADMLVAVTGPWMRYRATVGTWSTTPGISSQAGRVVALQSGDALGVGGFIIGGVQGPLARFSPATNAWTLVPGAQSVETYLPGMCELPNGDLLISTRAGASTGPGCSRLSLSSSSWSTLGRATNGTVSALVSMAQGDVIACGSFTTIGGVAANHVAKRSRWGGGWAPLGTGTDGFVLTTVADGASVTVGGQFTSAGGAPAANVARYDLGSGTWSALGGGMDGRVNVLVRLGNGDVVAGGTFSNAGGMAAGSIAVYGAASGTWSALGGGVSGTVNAIAVLPGGAMLVGGQFSGAGGVSASNIARYEPATGMWMSVGGTLDGPVAALATLASGEVEVATGASLGRYSAASNQVTMASGGIYGTFNELLALPSGEVIVGGSYYGYRTIGGVPDVTIRNAARLNPSTGVWSLVPEGAGDVRAMALLPGGDVVMAGAFAWGTTYGFVGTATVRSICAADFDCSGGLSTQDIFAYLNAWWAGDSRAEFDGEAGVTVMDVFAFLSAWFVGCG